MIQPIKKHILIINNQQYISDEDYEKLLGFKIFFELEKYYEITYIGFAKKEASKLKGRYASFVRLPFHGQNKAGKLLNFIFMNYIKISRVYNFKGDLVWIWVAGNAHHIFSFLYPLLFRRKKFFAQLGAVSVNGSKFKRKIQNSIARFSLLFYKNIGVNPHDTAGKLLIKTNKIPEKKIVPIKIGMPDYGFNEKNFNEIKLVYLGTLNGREIWKSVKGLAIFTHKYPDIPISYDLIGQGSRREVEMIMSEIRSSRLEHIVRYHGSLSVEQVKEVFSQCNIGVSYAPIRDYLENSSTKTVEYFLAGMAVIGTNSYVMRKLVKKESGVLCEDNPENFSDALYLIQQNLKKYNSRVIRGIYEHYSIEYTIKNDYIIHLNKIIEDK